MLEGNRTVILWIPGSTAGPQPCLWKLRPHVLHLHDSRVNSAIRHMQRSATTTASCRVHEEDRIYMTEDEKHSESLAASDSSSLLLSLKGFLKAEFLKCLSTAHAMIFPRQGRFFFSRCMSTIIVTYRNSPFLTAHPKNLDTRNIEYANVVKATANKRAGIIF